MINALTIDVEDYFMVSAFADTIKFEEWDKYESRVEMNTYKIIELLVEYNVNATFFVLGWIGEKYPQLVRDIHAAGHEIACHGYNHRLIYDLTPEEFRQDIRRAKSQLENTIGMAVIGFRAPSYSIKEETLWALEVLVEEGFSYDSSIFPIHHDRYGIPDAKRFQNVIECDSGSIKEFPLTTYKVANFNFPIAGGGYLRFLPIWLLKAAISNINKNEMQPAVVYLHPWEIDAAQPRLNGSMRSRFRHYINLDSTLPKLKELLTRFKFKQLSEFLPD